MNFISLTKRKHSLQFNQSIPPPPSEEIFLVSNIYLTKRITSLYFTSYSSPYPLAREISSWTLFLWQRGNSHWNFTPLPTARGFSSWGISLWQRGLHNCNLPAILAPYPLARKISSWTLSLWQRGNTHGNFISQSTLPQARIFSSWAIYIWRRG